MKKNSIPFNSKAITDYIRKLRLLRGYSQHDMANELNISKKSYCSLENGHTKITLERIAEISIIFNLSTIEFLSDYLNTNSFN